MIVNFSLAAFAVSVLVRSSVTATRRLGSAPWSPLPLTGEVMPWMVAVPLGSKGAVTGFAVFARAVGKPARMHMLLGRPVVWSLVGSKARGVMGSGAPMAGTPTPLGQAVPVVSTK